MATVINTPATQGDSGAAAGWAVAVVVLVAALVVALFVWPGYVRQSAAPAAPGANINVTLPTGDTGGTQSQGQTAPAN